ncbi:MAG: hypothetical protein AAB680_01285 [Pseudomonadota bacterium]
MTKKLAFSASGLVLAFLASPVMAGTTHMISANPCVLGSGAESHCQGAIRVTENIEITANGPSVSEGGYYSEAASAENYSASNVQHSSAAFAHNQNTNSGSQYSNVSGYSYSNESNGAQQHHSYSSQPVQIDVRTNEVREVRVMQTNAPQQQTCSAAVAQRVPCNGQWVVVGEAPPPMMYAPATPPVTYAPPPPPMMYAPQQPAMYAPAPAYYMPPPQQLAQISPSFFYGGMNNGVGYNMMTGYGGGGAIFVGGGSRFSGVVGRSPTPLVPPSRRQPPPPPPPPN